MSSLENLQNGSLGVRWKERFWRVLQTGDSPSEEFIVKFLDREAVVCRSLSAILSYVMDYPFFDTDDEITKAMMRLEIVKPLHHALTARAVKSKNMYGSVVLSDNTMPPSYATDPEELEEYASMEWGSEKPVEWNLFNDRTLLASLIRNDALIVLERADVFVLRADKTFLDVEIGYCGSCRYFHSDDTGTYCGAVLRETGADAAVGKVCTDFSPCNSGVVAEVSEVEYVRIDARDVYLPPFTANSLADPGDIEGFVLGMKKK